MRPKTAVILISIAGLLTSWITAVAAGLNYSAWADPGALTIAVRWFFAGLLFLVVLIALLVISAFRKFRRTAAASGLSPWQLALGEAAVIAVADYAWHEHNRRESAKLTKSVMGPERTELWPGN